MAFDLRRFARLGAQQRILQIRTETAEILRQFPDLDAPRRDESAFPPNELAALGGREKRSASSGRRRPRMSAAQRKAVGERMRKYWAQRKAASKPSGRVKAR